MLLGWWLAYLNLCCYNRAILPSRSVAELSGNIACIVKLLSNIAKGMPDGEYIP